MSDQAKIVPEGFLAAMSMPSEALVIWRDKLIPREPGWREGPNLSRQTDWDWACERFGGEPMDPGIIRIVRIFQEHEIETCQSCQGGEGHSYTWPTVDIYGDPWKALSVANSYDLPVTDISQCFGIRDGNPVEHFWRIEFSPAKLAPLRDEWYAQEAADRAAYLAWAADHPSLAEIEGDEA